MDATVGVLERNFGFKDLVDEVYATCRDTPGVDRAMVAKRVKHLFNSRRETHKNSHTEQQRKLRRQMAECRRRERRLHRRECLRLKIPLKSQQAKDIRANFLVTPDDLNLPDDYFSDVAARTRMHRQRDDERPRYVWN